MAEASVDPVGVLERACNATQAVLAAIGEKDLDRPTPCASWTVSDVIRHVLGSAAYFAELAEAGVGAGEEIDELGDFNGTFGRTAARLVAAFDSPGVLDKLLKMPIGAVPGSVVIWIASCDILTHGWDLAKAIDQSTDLDPELAQMILQRMYVTLPDSMRGTDGNAPFGPKVDVPSSAPAADRLAGYLGRTP